MPLSAEIAVLRVDGRVQVHDNLAAPGRGLRGDVVDDGAELWMALRGIGTRGHRGVAQHALGNLLLGGHGGVSILSRGTWLRVVRGIWRRVGLLVRTRGADATLGRARKACSLLLLLLLLLMDGRRGGERRVVLEDEGPGAVLGSQRHRVQRWLLMGRGMASNGWVNLSLGLKTDDEGGVRIDQFPRRQAAATVRAWGGCKRAREGKVTWRHLVTPALIQHLRQLTIHVRQGQTFLVEISKEMSRRDPIYTFHINTMERELKKQDLGYSNAAPLNADYLPLLICPH